MSDRQPCSPASRMTQNQHTRDVGIWQWSHFYLLILRHLLVWTTKRLTSCENVMAPAHPIFGPNGIGFGIAAQESPHLKAPSLCLPSLCSAQTAKVVKQWLLNGTTVDGGIYVGLGPGLAAVWKAWLSPTAAT